MKGLKIGSDEVPDLSVGLHGTTYESYWLHIEDIDLIPGVVGNLRLLAQRLEKFYDAREIVKGKGK